MGVGIHVFNKSIGGLCECVAVNEEKKVGLPWKMNIMIFDVVIW